MGGGFTIRLLLGEFRGGSGLVSYVTIFLSLLSMVPIYIGSGNGKGEVGKYHYSTVFLVCLVVFGSCGCVFGST